MDTLTSSLLPAYIMNTNPGAAGLFQVSVDKPKIDTFEHCWAQVVGAGRANEGLRADWQAHLKFVHTTCGFKYVRFHGLYHDDMHVIHEVDGKHVYNFQYIDALFDAMLDMGVRPFVEFGFCPSLIATEVDTVGFQQSISTKARPWPGRSPA